MQKSELTKLELYQEDDSYYLRAEYEVEDDYRLQKYIIPKLWLPISGNPVIKHDHYRMSYGDLIKNNREITIDLGFGDLTVLKGDDRYYYKCETLKEYPQKMTLDEIEKKLGYKVELVSGK